MIVLLSSRSRFSQQLVLAKLSTMIIPVNFSANASKASSSKLPPQLAKIGTDEVVLIELQGSLHTEGDRNGELIGILRIDEKVSIQSVCLCS